MCGIVGMIVDKNTKNTRKYIWQGLYLDALRGWDSTGLATVNEKKEITINKKAMAAQDFLSLREVDDQIDDYNNRVFIGHNRAATRGAVNHVNSHPFQHNHITMVHNGSLNHFRTFPEHAKFTVDSDAFAFAISKLGYKEALKKAEGAFALVWYDDDEKVVRMVRNSQRPLSYAVIKGENMVMYASEANMLRFLVYRAGYEIEEMHELPTHTVLTFNPSSKSIKDCTEEKVDFYKFNNYGEDWRNNSQQGGSFPHAGGQKGSKKGKEVKKETTAAGSIREANVEGMFKEVGIERGDELHVCMYEFRPYQNGSGKLGVWEGCTCHEPFVSVMAYSTTPDSFEEGEVYGAKASSMQVHVTPNYPDAIRENRVIIDPLTTRVISEDEFLEVVEKKDKEADDKKRKEEYNKKEDKEGSKKTTIILASEVDQWPTLEQQVTAMSLSIPLIDKNNHRKTRIRLIREIKFGQDNHPIYTKKEIGKKSIIVQPQKKDIKVVEDDDEDNVSFLYIEGPRGSIKLSEFTRLTHYGCSNCGGNIHVDDAPHMDWIGDMKNSPICPTCVNDWLDNMGSVHLH